MLAEGFGKEKPTTKWLTRSVSEKSIGRGSFDNDEDEPEKGKVEVANGKSETVFAKPAPKPPGSSRPPVKKSVLARYAHVTGSADQAQPEGHNRDDASVAKPAAGGSAGGPTDYSVDEEIVKLCDIAERLVGGPRGIFKFKDIFYDDEAESAFESLVGTLIAARKRKILVFDSPMLLQGVHDDLDIVFTGRP